MPPLASGTRLGSYEVVAPLGAGGMGEVYRARDPRLGRDVALKLLPEALASDPERLARFEREARAVAALNHPNIVTIHSIEQDGATRFITMELVDGGALDRLVVDGGLPLAQVLELATGIADALAAAHDRGIVHRDLKPGNVMVTADGRVKVLDFGLAKLDEPAADAGDATQALSAAPLSSAGQVLGTIAYMAPEQVRGEQVDARADLFALGVVLYELLTGRRPFAGRTSADVGSSILRDTPRPLGEARTDLPADVARIVGRCLEKDRDRRFPGARDVRSELDRVRRASESGASHAPATPPASIAVLPFANMSADPENEFFADGLSEELLNVLARNAALKVAGRTSSFAFKGKSEDLRTIGQKLGVATLLEGSVRRAGNRVRITAQLVKVTDGFHLWSATYDRVLDDIFAVQDEIAGAVADALHVALLGGATQPTRGVAQTFGLVLQANRLLAQQSESSMNQAASLYRQAIDAAPGDARAWAGLARTYASQVTQGFGDVLDGYRAARKAVDRALELDPLLADAHEALCFMLSAFEYRWEDSYRAGRRAIELAPNNTRALVTCSVIESIMGNLDEAIRLATRATENDPLAAGAHIVRSRVLSWQGRFEEAVTASRRALELSPEMVAAHSSLGLSLASLGRLDEARAESEKERSTGYRSCAMAIVHHLAGDAASANRALADLLAQGEQWAFQFAMVYAVRGEADAAFEWLERAYFLHDAGIGLTGVSPYFENLHADPRWPKLLERFGLPRREA